MSTVIGLLVLINFLCFLDEAILFIARINGNQERSKFYKLTEPIEMVSG